MSLAGRRRKLVLTVHVASSVALLGTTAGLAVMAGHAGASADAGDAHAVYEVMQLLALALGIPLSFAALISGIVLALAGRWGLLGYWWVTAKLALLAGVIVVGATLTGASIGSLLDATAGGGSGAAGAPAALLAALAAQGAMVLLATVLSVFRPGGRIRRPAAVRDART